MSGNGAETGDPFGPSPPPSPYAPPPPQRPWRPQFGLQSMLAVMALCSVMAAALAGLLQQRMSGIVIALAAPMGLMVLVALVRAGTVLLGRRRR